MPPPCWPRPWRSGNPRLRFPNLRPSERPRDWRRRRGGCWTRPPRRWCSMGGTSPRRYGGCARAARCSLAFGNAARPPWHGASISSIDQVLIRKEGKGKREENGLAMRQAIPKITRIFIVVLDGVGAGELPDADRYGDVGSNTLAHTAAAVGGLRLPQMQRLGLGNIIPIMGVSP